MNNEKWEVFFKESESELLGMNSISEIKISMDEINGK